MEYQNGIYFGLDFDEYLAIERLSKSAIKQIRISPADFWRGSWLDPNPPMLTPEQEKRRELAKVLGKAYHCARLEPDVFHERYVREISQSDFANVEGFIATGKDMGEQLERMGEKKSGSVMEQAERLHAAGYKGPIWHLELREWEIEKGDRIAIPAQSFDEILVDQARIHAVPSVHALLSDGFPEVSILYDCPDTGLPMKARLDWLRADGWVEFKSFSNPSGKHLEQCLLDAIKYNRYYIDVACYHEAVEAIRNNELDVVGAAIDEQHNMVAAIGLTPTPLPHKIVFQQKDGIPNILSRSLKLYELPLPSQLARIGSPTEADVQHGDEATKQPTQLMAKARAEIRNAKITFQRYSEIYERGEPWLPWDPDGEYSDLDFPPYFLESI